MPKYITTRTMTYNTRRLKAGDELVGVSERDGNLLVRLGRAARVPDALAQSNFKVPPPPVVPPKPAVTETPAPAAPVVTETPDTDESPAESSIAVAREEYRRVFGKREFPGWDEAELRKRIAEHQSSDAADASA
jgi:hypothetical protein